MKVLVVDDHPLVRDAMSHLVTRLDDHMQVLEAPDGTSGLQLAREHPDLDLALLDLDLPGPNGMEVLARLRRECPSTPVVIVSMAKDADSILAALRLGAMGYIPKTSDRDTMLGALKLVLTGNVYLPPDLAMGSSRLDAGPARRSTRERSRTTLPVTDRQGQVLALVMKGRTNKEICRELGLAERTVKAHLTAVLNALKVASRTQAVIAASRLGLDAEELLAASSAERAGEPSTR